MKTGLHIAALVGIVLAVALIAYHGFGAVAETLLSVGWGLIGISLFHLVPLLCSALGWQAVMRSGWRGGLPLFVWARWIREAVNTLLPVAQIGGDVVGARVLTFHGARARLAGAGVVADLTLEVVTQFAFTLMGLALLVLVGADERVVGLALAGLAVGAPVVIGFVFAQRWGLLKLLERLLEKLADKWGWAALGSLSNLHETLMALYKDRRGVLLGSVLHLLSWVIGAGEIWLALYLMGAEVTVYEALILESLGQAVRSAAFLVPGAIGVQEGGYLLLGALFGLSPEVALALSLVKRVRELFLGLPVLLAWPIIEGKRLWLEAERGKNGAARPRA